MADVVLDRAGHLTDYGLDEYVLGRLEAQTVRRVEAHLKRCRRCTEAAESLRKVIQSLRSAKAAKG